MKDPEKEIDAWCSRQSVLEIGTGPYPEMAAAKEGWRWAVGVDPLAQNYMEEDLCPPACKDMVFISAKAEAIPVCSRSADLVIADNCLDHVLEPAKVVAEAFRLLRRGGWLWLFVDFSEKIDPLHPHALNKERLHALLADFELMKEEISDVHSHPDAYGSCRALWQKPE